MVRFKLAGLTLFNQTITGPSYGVNIGRILFPSASPVEPWPSPDSEGNSNLTR
jgi:hypothetical protein